MKKYFVFFFSLCMVLVLFSSCRGKEVKQAKGLVKEITPHYMILSVDGDDEMKIGMLDDVKYPNGAVMSNDSVIVTYVSSSEVDKAAVIQLIPRKSEVIELGHDDKKPLETSRVDHGVDSIQ